VRQSGDSLTNGHITKQESQHLRCVLTQAGHVLLWRCQSELAAPLKAKGERVAQNRGRRKIAVVAATSASRRLASPKSVTPDPATSVADAVMAGVGPH
jgi:hypothetical protein